jgi:multiple antibiotic resistance protein
LETGSGEELLDHFHLVLADEVSVLRFGAVASAQVPRTPGEMGVAGLLALSVACVAMAGMMALVFWYAPAIGRLMGPSGIKISTQIMGLIVTAIASQMVLNGVKSAYPFVIGAP